MEVLSVWGSVSLADLCVKQQQKAMSSLCVCVHAYAPLPDTALATVTVDGTWRMQASALISSKGRRGRSVLSKNTRVFFICQVYGLVSIKRARALKFIVLVHGQPLMVFLPSSLIHGQASSSHIPAVVAGVAFELWEFIFYRVPILVEWSRSSSLAALRHVVIAQKCSPWCLYCLLWCLIANGCFWLLTVVSYCSLIYLLVDYKLYLNWTP